MQGEIRNKVQESALITLDLEAYYDPLPRVTLDIKDQLFNGLVLKEKDFRAFVKAHDWAAYQGKYVAIGCSADAIVPTWAYMLIATALTPYAKDFVFGEASHLENHLLQQALSKIDFRQYQDAKVIIKGCSKFPIPEYAYVELSRRLTPWVSSLMYGEACSAVPIYKKPKAK